MRAIDSMVGAGIFAVAERGKVDGDPCVRVNRDRGGDSASSEFRHPIIIGNRTVVDESLLSSPDKATLTEDFTPIQASFFLSKKAVTEETMDFPSHIPSPFGSAKGGGAERGAAPSLLYKFLTCCGAVLLPGCNSGHLPVIRLRKLLSMAVGNAFAGFHAPVPSFRRCKILSTPYSSNRAKARAAVHLDLPYFLAHASWDT